MLLNKANGRTMLLVLSIAGGKGTLETIRDSLNNGTPVVLVTGFGRATDLLEFAIQNTNEEAKEGTVNRYAEVETHIVEEKRKNIK